MPAGRPVFVAMLAVTLIGNVPITRSLLQLDPGTADATFGLRTGWTRWRLIRNALNISRLALTGAATLHRPTREPRRPSETHRLATVGTGGGNGEPPVPFNGAA